MSKKPTPSRPPEPPPVAIVVSRYNGSVTTALLNGALTEYASRFPDAPPPPIFGAPGSFELPALALHTADSGYFRGVLALGCIIKGETSHDRHIADAVAQGLIQVTMITGVPAAFGVLTVDNAQQAVDRAGGKMGNKGQESMSALLDSIASLDEIGAFRGVQSEPALSGSARPDKAAKPSRTAPARARRSARS